MAIVHIGLRPSTTLENKASVSKGPIKMYRRRYVAESDNQHADNSEILADPLCPKIGSRDPYDDTAIVDSVVPERSRKSDVGYHWEIQTTSTTDFEQIDDPRNEPADVDWAAQQFKRSSYFDRDGKPVFNAAGDLMLYHYDESLWVASIGKDVSAVPDDIFDYENAINKSDAIIDGRRAKAETLRAFQVRVSRWNKTRVGTLDIYTKRITLSVIHNPAGWDIEIPNVGFNEIACERRPLQNTAQNILSGDPAINGPFLVNPDTGEPVYGPARRVKRLIRYDDGMLPTQPELLDSRGQWIRNPTPQDVLNNMIRVKPKGTKVKDFSRLPGIGDAPQPRGKIRYR